MSYTKLIHGVWMDTRVTYDKRLAYCPYGSAGVNVTFNPSGAVYTLRSYDTEIMSAYTVPGRDTDNGDMPGVALWGDWFSYSATTRKHVGAFLREYAPWLCYADVKRAWRTVKQWANGASVAQWGIYRDHSLTEDGLHLWAQVDGEWRAEDVRTEEGRHYLRSVL